MERLRECECVERVQPNMHVGHSTLNLSFLLKNKQTLAFPFIMNVGIAAG